MTTRLFALATLGLVAVLASAGPCPAQESSKLSDDQRALAALAQEVDSAYNAQDAARLSAVFAEDADFQFSVEGLTLRGRDEIKRHFATQFATLPPMRHVTTTGTINAITPQILAADFQLDILAVDPGTGAASTVLCHYSGLSLGVRTDSGWRIRLLRLYRMTK